MKVKNRVSVYVNLSLTNQYAFRENFFPNLKLGWSAQRSHGCEVFFL